MEIKDRAKAFSEKVAPVYKLLNWTWNNWEDKALRIPEAKHIEEAILELIDTANKNNDFIASGGLFAQPEGWGQEPGVTFGMMIEDRPK